MSVAHNTRFPGEDPAYRQARDELLDAELKLDRMVKRVASLRRDLPLGGPVPQDYCFQTLADGVERDIRLSELFAPDKDTLFLYSFMYAPSDSAPCPACTSLVDGFNGIADHIADRINMAVVAKAPISKTMELAKSRGWTKIRFLSSHDNSFNEDYHAVNTREMQIPAANVFVRKGNEVRHFWSAELLYVDRPEHPRHVDQIWPIWNILDMTPEGRGTDWFPKLNYAD